ncbi:MAG TPA: sigma-70 family RNA polymerase sigma factor [Blastocatellia bacterium]|nr:sigma-70 family RNA polymerase sigma factor [Blastocatellia bacterium]
MKEHPRELTELLLAWREGDETALDQLIPIVYEELHKLARRYMARQARGHLLQTTALVHEAYIRLLRERGMEWQNRAHFFAICATIMRNLLVDHFRRRRNHLTVELDEALAQTPAQDVDVIALNEALNRLAALDHQKGQIVEMRFFGGMTEEEVAEVLKIAPITVKREWRRARAWLFHELNGRKTDDT